MGGTPDFDQLDDASKGRALLPPIAASRVVGCRRAFGEACVVAMGDPRASSDEPCRTTAIESPPVVSLHIRVGV